MFIFGIKQVLTYKATYEFSSLLPVKLKESYARVSVKTNNSKVEGRCQ